MGVSPKSDDAKAWAQASHAKVDHVKGRQEQVRQALLELEHKEQDRIAIQIAEKHRQEARAEALERKRQREALLRAEEERKQALAAELQGHRDKLEASKADAKEEVKAATAKFLQKTELDAKAREMALQMKAMSDVVQQVGLTASKCMHECRMKFSAVKVCEMRLAMRENRPQQEAFRDEVDEALEKELQALNVAREELLQMAKAGEQVRQEIVEVQALLTTGNSRENVTKRMQKSSSLPSLVVVTLSGAPSHQDLLQRGTALVEKAQRIDGSAVAALAKSTEECEKAKVRVAACFHKRSSETGELKRNLEYHKKEVAATISQAERRLQMLKMRTHRTPETPRSSEATQEQMRGVEDLIMELREGKRNLEDDYRMKTSSFKVDKSCMGLTKVKAGSHVGRTRLPGVEDSK